MRGEGSRLPWTARVLLKLLVPRGLRDEIEGDLTERYAALSDGKGRGDADRWLRAQLLSIRPTALRRALRAVGLTRSDGGVGAGPTGRTSWGAELRLAYRALRARPGAALTVIATGALSVGATTAVFSVVNGVLLTPLPFPEPERLVSIWQVKRGWLDSPSPALRDFARQFPLSVPTFNDWVAADLGFDALGAGASRSYVVRTTAGAEILPGQAFTSGVFTALGIEPEIGRTLQPEDDAPGAPRVAVLSHDLWIERYGGAREVLGRDLVLDGVAHTIVGVMPSSFRPPDGGRVWAPLTEEEKTDGRQSQFLGVVGRLAPGVTIEVAGQRLAALQERLATAYPDAQDDVGARVESLLDSMVGNVRSSLWFLLGAVGMVLLIASVNLANLLSVMGLSRRRELAIKVALGAGRGRLARGLLIESGLLAGLGGLIGVGLAWASLPVIALGVPSDVPRHEAIAMDARVLVFGILVTAVTALLVGALPSLQASLSRPADVIRASGRGTAGDRSGTRLRAALVVGEVAMAFLLLVGAGLLGTSFWRLWSVDRGFDPRGLVVLSAYPDPQVYPTRDERDVYTSELTDRLAGIPGVEVTASNQVPLGGSVSSTSFHLERDASEPEETNVVVSVVLENYFDVMRIPVVEGRSFSASDTRDAPQVVIVNQAAAAALWPGESPLGKHVRDDEDDPWATVVGVAGNVRHKSLSAPIGPKFYLPAAQSGRTTFNWILRARDGTDKVIRLAREAVTAVSPSTPVRNVALLEDRIAGSVAVPRFRTYLVVGLAAMAGLLALLGVFGVVMLSVTQRTREIGVRRALGAGTTTVVRDVVRSGLLLATSGAALGVLVAIPMSRVVRDFLFEIEPTDPATYVAVALGVVLVGIVASYVPARRAAAVDPVSVLNTE